MLRYIALAAAAATLALAQTCPTQPDTPGCQCVERQDVRIIAITHGATQVDGSHDSFWSVVHDGFVTSAAGLGVQVEHYAPTAADVVNTAMSDIFDNLVDKAIAEQPDGVVISIPSNAIVDAALVKLEAAGAPPVPKRSLLLPLRPPLACFLARIFPR